MCCFKYRYKSISWLSHREKIVRHNGHCFLWMHQETSSKFMAVSDLAACISNLAAYVSMTITDAIPLAHIAWNNTPI